tara:strand:- start:4226 stop:5218 length:993 start_codon:yes stop_codon:yes gene_type:complete
MKSKIYQVYWGADGYLYDNPDCPEFESDSIEECEKYIENAREEYIAEFGEFSKHNLYDWHIHQKVVPTLDGSYIFQGRRTLCEEMSFGPNGLLTINHGYNMAVGLSTNGRFDGYKELRDLFVEKELVEHTGRDWSLGHDNTEKALGLRKKCLMEALDLMEAKGIAKITKFRVGGEEVTMSSTYDYSYVEPIEVDYHFRFVVFTLTGYPDDDFFRGQYIAISRKTMYLPTSHPDDQESWWGRFQIFRLMDWEKLWCYVEEPSIKLFTGQYNEIRIKHHLGAGKMWPTEQGGYYYSTDDWACAMYREIVDAVEAGKTNLHPIYAKSIWRERQ